MDENTEYERFAREIYQGLIKADGINTIDVKHNVKLRGKSGQEHQIDVYWEYELAGVKHKVAIECKNYKSPVPIGKVRDFHSVLSDLNNVAGIMLTKVGYQKGAKDYASHYGIELKELRNPTQEEGKIAEIKLNFNISIHRTLYLIDKQWAKINSFPLERMREFYDLFSPELNPKGCDKYYLPLQTPQNASIINGYDEIITTLKELDRKSFEEKDHNSEFIYTFENAFIDTKDEGKVKIKEVKICNIIKNETNIIDVDARYFIKAILKDAISGNMKIITI